MNSASEVGDVIASSASSSFTYYVFATPAPAVQANGGEDPHMKFCAAGKAECRGLAFSIVSEKSLQVNAEVDRLAGPDAWPAAGTWVTGLGLRYRTSLAVELRMRKDVDHTIVPDGDKTRALPPKGASAGAAGLRALLAAATVNGQNVLAKVGSGETLDVAAGTLVHFPDSTHPADPTDGPVMVIVTPTTTWTWYIESEDTWHLDFKVEVNAPSAIKQMHGLLGQSLHWAASAPAAVEGGDDMLYVVADGLLGTDTKFGLFGKPAPASGSRRALTAAAPAAAGPLAAGSAAALQLA
ncbi:MAG: hypothetical protein J3K34DRAFT_391954 [Monoraphidium minutum]|nr:MAG: hypothetical protein J3K34DRAFT_391954 [Monoraphidium minutum]